MRNRSASLVDAKAGGIRTDALAASVRGRGWNTIALEGSGDAMARDLRQGRPVIALLEDRPRTYHYVVVVARNDDGVVLHDPARAPFRVMSTRISRGAGRLRPMDAHRHASGSPRVDAPVTAPRSAATSCDAQIAFAVEAGAAEQTGGIGTDAGRCAVVSWRGSLS